MQRQRRVVLWHGAGLVTSVRSQSLTCALAPKNRGSGLVGIGYNTAGRLKALNVATCGDLEKLTLATLQAEFGDKTGTRLYRCSRGEDDKELKVAQKRQSVSAEINYGIRLKEHAEAITFIHELAKEVGCRLKKAGVKGGRLTLKVKVRRPDAPMKTVKYMGHGICDNMSKACQLRPATDDFAVISKECARIYSSMHIVAADLRGVGIQIHKLVPLTTTEDAKHGPAAGSLLSLFGARNQDEAASILNVAPARAEDHRAPPATVEKACFCGFTDISEVKVALRDWISESTAGPQFRDESLVVNYLVDLIDTKEMDVAHHLMAFMFLQMSKSVNEEWEQCYARMSDVVQAHVKEQYGGVLKLPS